MKLRLSGLPHTWLIDLDGTVLQHNGYQRGTEVLLPGVQAFWAQIPASDRIVLLSARPESEAGASIAFLNAAGLRFDHVLFGLPTGERILINDIKPLGLETALAVNLPRDQGLQDCMLTIETGSTER